MTDIDTTQVNSLNMFGNTNKMVYFLKGGLGGSSSSSLSHPEPREGAT